ncbi:MAG: malonyl-CoA decarboxylase N-terminal domain-containing protein, partial [Pseudomonadota bacterium]
MSETPKDRSLLDAVLATIVGSGGRAMQSDLASIKADCRALLNLGPDAGKRVAQRVLDAFEGLSEDDRLAFFRFLNEDLDLDPASLATLAGRYGEKRDPGVLADLLKASEPPRQELLRRLNAQPGATAALVAMRAQLLEVQSKEPALKRADLDFQHLFSSWFNRGFLDLQRITWDSPASVLAKIIAYEAVHAINGWGDLRSRLQPADRRCYAFF